MRPVAGLLHQVDDPVPVAGGLDGDFSPTGQRVEIALIGCDVVLDPYGLRGFAPFVDRDEDRVVLVGVTSEKRLHESSSLMENLTHLAEATSAFMQSPPKGWPVAQV